MGDFSVACGVSRMSLNGREKCVLIPLTETKHSDDIFEGAMYVSNDGPIGRFQPLTLPIFGEYNSYGTLKNIEENCNTKAIEKHYGCTIEEFVQHMCSLHHSDIKDSNTKVPKKPWAMFVKREVYDDLANNPINEYGRKDVCNNELDLNSFVLRYLGFLEDKTLKYEGEGRYKRGFKHDKIPNLTIWSDGTWNRFQIGSEAMKDNYIYHPEQLAKFLKKHKMFVMQDRFDALKVLRPGEMHYDSDYQKLQKVIKVEELAAEKVKDMNREDIAKAFLAMSEIREYMASINFLRFGNWSTNQKDFRAMYGDLFNNQEFRGLFIDYKTFEHQLYFVNAPLMPSWCGIQYGCTVGELKLAKLVTKLCKEKIRQRDKDR